MLTHPTLEQLRQPKLDGMADAFAEMSKQDDTADLIPTARPGTRSNFSLTSIADEPADHRELMRTTIVFRPPAFVHQSPKHRGMNLGSDRFGNLVRLTGPFRLVIRTQMRR